MYNINYFKNTVKDLARPNRFLVEIGTNSDFLSTVVKKVNIPQITVNEFVFERAGQKLHIPTHTEYGDLSITFFNDEKYIARKFFINWIKTMYDWENNKLNPLTSLIPIYEEIKVSQLNNMHAPTHTVKFINCWPKNISNIDFSHDNDSQVLDFTVDFCYTRQEFQ